jgi:hypothetical protein
MKAGHLKPLVWPVALLAVGVALGWLAEQAVGRWQDYQMYGIARPVSDLTVVIGAVWLIVAAIRMLLAARRR